MNTWVFEEQIISLTRHADGGFVLVIFEELRGTQHGFYENGKKAERFDKPGEVDKKPGHIAEYKPNATHALNVVYKTRPPPEIAKVKI